MTSRANIERRLKAVEERAGSDYTFTATSIVLVGICPAVDGGEPTEGRRSVLWSADLRTPAEFAG